MHGKDPLTSTSAMPCQSPVSSSLGVGAGINHPQPSQSVSTVTSKRQIPEEDDDDDEDGVCVLSVFKKQRMQTLELSQKEGMDLIKK